MKGKITAFATAALLLLALASTATAATVRVSLGSPSEMRISLPASVKAGKVTFKVVNRGVLGHDFRIAGRKTRVLKRGQSATLTVTLRRGTYKAICTVAGHAASGMVATLRAR